MTNYFDFYSDTSLIINVISPSGKFVFHSSDFTYNGTYQYNGTMYQVENGLAYESEDLNWKSEETSLLEENLGTIKCVLKQGTTFSTPEYVADKSIEGRFDWFTIEVSIFAIMKMVTWLQILIMILQGLISG